MRVPTLCTALALLAAACFAEQKTIQRVQLMPREPAPYQMRDWNKVARDYDSLVFDFDAKGQFLPLIKLDKSHTNYRADSFVLVTYIGSRSTETSWIGGEGINCIAAVVGATLAGIDKSNQKGHNFVAMTQKWFNSDNGENVYLNTPSAHTGRTFWYELFPNILSYQLNSLYPGTDQMPKQALAVADRYYDASVELGGRREPWTLPDYNHLSFSLLKGQPVDNNRWREPDAAAGIAWLEYMAWTTHKDAKYLAAADWGMQYLDRRERNAYYEVLLPYAAYVAARMNAELGRTYNVEKLLNWSFDGDSDCRRGWGAIAESWSGVDAYGLIGSITDGGGYGFAMNTYEQVGALVPLVRYDDRFAHDIGKWVLNAANASRLFFANGHPPERQSSWSWAKEYDKNFALSYEAVRKVKRASTTPEAESTIRGRIVSGSYASTAYREDGETEVLDGNGGLEHAWEVPLAPTTDRGLHLAARADGGVFRFSWSNSSEGPYQPLFIVNSAQRGYWYRVPDDIRGKFFIKAEGTIGRLTVDAIQIQYRTELGPYGQGDALPGRRPGSLTDFALYGGSHVGILGGIVRTTNVEKILQLDLLRTDYYRDPAYPSYLYYNPYGTAKTVDIEVGSEPKDLYDAATNAFVKKTVRGRTSFSIPADTAVVLVVAPANGKLTREGNKTRIDGVVVDYVDR